MHTELKKGVYWVGVVDWGIRRFHGHELSVHRGTTYNAYLIVDEKIALVDTVWAPFAEELIENIREIVDPAKIDIVVANHAEPDHSSGLPAVMRHCPNATLVVSRRGRESVEAHCHQPWNFQAVQTGDRLSLGKCELLFNEAPLLHWPDTMFTYVTGHNILMSNDAFGQHYATAFRFNDRVNAAELMEEALKYYVNIITPFSDRVTKKLEELKGLNLAVDIIAPSHGVIWRENPMQILAKYGEWAAQKPEPRAVVFYDSMWEATRRMADAIGAGLAEAGVEYKLVNAAVTDRNDTLVDIFRARTLVVGSPTLNNGMLPTMLPLLHEMRGLKFHGKIGAAFGSYGWSGEAVKHIEEFLASCKIPLIREGLRCKWQPRVEDLIACRAFGREVGEATLKPV